MMKMFVYHCTVRYKYLSVFYCLYPHVENTKELYLMLP